MKRRLRQQGQHVTAPTRVVDMSAGPPSRPHSDPGIDDLVAEHEGTKDSALYDRDSFVDGTDPLTVQAIKARYSARVASSQREEPDDEEVQSRIVADASTALVVAHARYERTDADLKQATDERDELAREVLDAGGASRRREPARLTVASMLGIPAGGLAVETPWSYFALQVLGEPTLATVAMAVLFGALGVLLSEIGGVTLRRARHSEGAERVAMAGIAVVATLVLVVLGVFLADLRTAYLATPLAGTTKSGLSIFGLSKSLVFFGWFAANMGLWLAIGVVAYLRHVPGLRALQRADTRVEVLTDELAARHMEVAECVASLDQARVRLEHVPGLWDAHRLTLYHETLRSIALYRRGLAHAKADPEFTTALEQHELALDLAEPRRAKADGEDDDRSDADRAASIRDIRTHKAPSEEKGEPA